MCLCLCNAQVLAEDDKPVPHNDMLEEELEEQDIDPESGQIQSISR